MRKKKKEMHPYRGQRTASLRRNYQPTHTHRYWQLVSRETEQINATNEMSALCNASFLKLASLLHATIYIKEDETQE